MCPWEGLSPWEAWAIEMTAPGMELLTEMQNQFLMSEQGLVVEEEYPAWVEDEAEVVAVQVEELVVLMVMTKLLMEQVREEVEEGCHGTINFSDGFLLLHPILKS